jgi:tRNA uridine 5-carbamoylmethylation protein Kti12
MSMNGKFAFIMRGVPGSGKTTTAQMLAGESGIIHAVDIYHTDEQGNFLWSDELAEARYQKNFEEFVKSLDLQIPIVVCDCINVTRIEYLKYVRASQERGYTTSTVTMCPISPESSEKRNKHDVTAEQVKEMYERWEN